MSIAYLPRTVASTARARATRISTFSFAFLLGISSQPELSRADAGLRVTENRGSTGREPERNELTVIPVLGGSSDRGFGGGYLLSHARVSDEHDPYLLRLESGGATTFKGDGEFRPTYTDLYLLLHLPHAIPRSLDVELLISFTLENQLKFYGLGNASEIPAGADPEDDHFEHSRIHPTARWIGKYHLTEHLDWIWGAAYTHNWLEVPPGSLLDDRMREGSALEQRLLGDARAHGVAQFFYGMAWDTRDSVVTPTHGQFHVLRADLAPGGPSFMPYTWMRLFLATHAYVPVVRERLTFGVRVVSDLLFGDPPFYELPRYDDTNAIGGSQGVRGIPSQRYYGKAKLLANFELRADIFSFRFWDKQNLFGLTGFFDTGRLWTDYRPLPALDGRGTGLKFGTGGGIRLTAGESFVVRADVGWSPQSGSLRGYLLSGHMF